MKEDRERVDHLALQRLLDDDEGEMIIVFFDARRDKVREKR